MRRNEQIRARELRVIGPEGEQLGILGRNEAIAMAKEHGLDLVEVAATADPPVCRVMDYGKFKYETQKKKQEAKKRQTVVQIKERQTTTISRPRSGISSDSLRMETALK